MITRDQATTEDSLMSIRFVTSPDAIVEVFRVSAEYDNLSRGEKISVLNSVSKWCQRELLKNQEDAL